VEDAVYYLVGRVQLHRDLARIGVDGKGLMLCDRDWREYDT
jgi:23S rRNA G2445 N2-methylase RlmL